ncbi:MAG TPA: hypothetical protein VFD41_06725 [Actinomycetales bacterium]|nr:hypothetical protein [Actinomycetales bacterium]
MSTPPDDDDRRIVAAEFLLATRAQEEATLQLLARTEAGRAARRDEDEDVVDVRDPDTVAPEGL